MRKKFLPLIDADQRGSGIFSPRRHGGAEKNLCPSFTLKMFIYLSCFFLRQLSLLVPTLPKRTARVFKPGRLGRVRVVEALLLLLGSTFLGGFLCSGFAAGFCALAGLLFRGSCGARADAAWINQVQGVFSVERVLAH